MLSTPILRRSTRILRVRQISSAMSVGVTEPKSEPVGPAFTSKRSTVFVERLGDRLRLLGRLRLVPRPFESRFWSSATRAGVASSASLRGKQEVARVAACDRDDLAAEADLLDVLGQDDVHQRSSRLRPRPRPSRSLPSTPSATYGRSAISRARFTAVATCT